MNPENLNIISQDQIEEEKRKLREEFEEKIAEIKSQYEEEKLSKEALQKNMDTIQAQYDSQLVLLNTDTKPPKTPGKDRKSGKGQRKSATLVKESQNNHANAQQIDQMDMTDLSVEECEPDPAQRLLKLQELVVGGEQANNEELKKKNRNKKKYAEERKQLLADSLRKGDDEEFMLRVYDSVQEEVQFKTKLYEKERDKCKFLEDECKDLQQEFEKDRQDMLDTIRKNERQMKLIAKILQKLQPIIPPDSNYYNLDKIQAQSFWNEEAQDWICPDFKREKLSLPAMGIDSQNDFEQNGENYEITSNSQMQMMPQGHGLLRRQSRHDASFIREPEVDRYRIKLESSQFNGSNYFKTRRQSELLGQTTDQRANSTRLSPLTNSDHRSDNSAGSRAVNRRYN